MSPPRYKSIRTSKSGKTREPNVSSGIHLPPITAIDHPAYESLEPQPPSQQEFLAHTHYQVHQFQDGIPPRHVPPIRSMSSSSSTSTRQGIAPIHDLLNKDPELYERSAVSSISGSVLASPVQSSNRGSPAKGGSAYYSTVAVRYPEQTTNTDSQRRSMLPPTAIPSNRCPESNPTTFSQTLELPARSRARLKLIIRQQPKAARACGLGERDRRVIDPPPILQLKVQDYDANSEADRNLLRSPFNITHCQLISAVDDNSQQFGQDVTIINDPNDPSKELRRLMGQLAISPFITKDLHPDTNQRVPEAARIGSYYIFSDLSCRQAGRYRLRFMLTPVESEIPVGGRIETGDVVESNEFTVYSAKDFPGMLQSSDLTKQLKNLGASVPIKKGNEGRKTNAKKRASDNSEGSGNET